MLAAFVGFIAPLAIAVLLVLGYGLQVSATMPKTVSAIPAETAGPDAWQLSSDQERALSENGHPESFAILFYDEEGEDGSLENVRYETWSYYTRGLEMTFINGELETQTALDRFSAKPGSLSCRPEQFAPYMDLAEVVRAAGLSSFTMTPLEDQLLPGGETYFADRLTFGLIDGELRYIETLPTVEEG
ncbi:MAG: hypothetical protein A2Z30_08090 [Chloroflexi bacterium RBG_16_64_43]|nr:MAG: hypothetical protein A2Z30_08090 [Chloroflexi bacterium RBG_16_64_43]